MRNIAAMRVDLGASLMGRSLRFQSSAVDGAPSGYHTKPVPGGHFEAELYPLAFNDRTKTIAGLGIGGEFDQVQGITMPTADGTASVKITDRRYSVGARFRIAFGHRATSPTVTLGAGYGERKFAGGMTTGVPDVDYRMIDPSLMARVPIGSRITAFAGGRGMLMLSAGGITKADQYGRANAMGATATAGLEVGLASHVALRLAAEGTQVNLKFYGQGTLSSMLDGDPATVDVQKARDRYYGGDATIAITY
jgi:opacity protein-like surface antigen